MKRWYSDGRLPKGIKVYHNDWEEFVAVEVKHDVIAKVKSSRGVFECVGGSRTLEGAITKYLNNDTSPCYLN